LDEHELGEGREEEVTLPAMKTVIAALFVPLALASVPNRIVDTYQVTPVVGDHDFMFSFRQNAKLVFGPPQDNALSAWQELPFPLKFFGQPVTGFYVSDNGFITFDKTAKASPAANTTLPNAAAPRNSIFALWTDLRMETGATQWVGTVYTATMGASPNRVHLIYWMGVVPAADTFATSSFNFSLALYENGEFEVIYSSGRKATPIKATVGVLNADGQLGVLAAGPAMDYPAVGFGGDDDQGFKFKPITK
jgi:hypothetical protein